MLEGVLVVLDSNGFTFWAKLDLYSVSSGRRNRRAR